MKKPNCPETVFWHWRGHECFLPSAIQNQRHTMASTTITNIKKEGLKASICSFCLIFLKQLSKLNKNSPINQSLDWKNISKKHLISSNAVKVRDAQRWGRQEVFLVTTTGHTTATNNWTLSFSTCIEITVWDSLLRKI